MELQEMKTALNAKFKQALQEAHLEDLPKGEREAALKALATTFKNEHQSELDAIQALKGELSLEQLDEVAGGLGFDCDSMSLGDYRSIDWAKEIDFFSLVE